MYFLNQCFLVWPDCAFFKRVLFSLENKSHKVNLVSIHLRRRKEDRARLFSVVLRASTRGNGHKLKERRLSLNIGKH